MGMRHICKHWTETERDKASNDETAAGTSHNFRFRKYGARAGSKRGSY